MGLAVTSQCSPSSASLLLQSQLAAADFGEGSNAVHTQAEVGGSRVEVTADQVAQRLAALEATKRQTRLVSENVYMYLHIRKLRFKLLLLWFRLRKRSLRLRKRFSAA